MLKRIGNIFIVVLASLASAQVCVKPVFPFGKDIPTSAVLAELAKHKIMAEVCGSDPQQTEIYFYPLQISLTSDETNFWISAQPTSNGLVGTISTYKNHYNDQIWVVSVHPWGEIPSSKRQMGFSLKSQTGKIAKWLNKGEK